MNTVWMIGAMFMIGGLFVFFPMSKLYRYKKIVRCPETDQPAEILVDASPRSKKKRFSIRNCSLWPQRKGCTQNCIK